MTTMACPAGVHNAPLPRNVPATGHNPLTFLAQLAREDGDIARFSHGVPAVLISHPRDIEWVLRETDWGRQRTAMALPLHHMQLASAAATLAASTERMLATWQHNTTRDVYDDLLLLMHRTVAHRVFGADGERDAPQFLRALDEVLHEFNAERLGVTQFGPTPGRARLQVAGARIDQLIAGIINARRADPRDRHDLLALFLEARDDDGNRMTDQQLHDAVVTLYSTGHETTAATLAWTWLLLAQHADVRAALEAELQQVLGRRTPSLYDVARLPYTNAVLKEAMRLYPAVWQLTRVASEDVELGGYQIAQATEVWLSPWVVHRDARWFERPTVFNPQQWLDGLEARLPRYAYFPGGGGRHRWFGTSGAMVDNVLLVATIAQRFRLDLASATPVVPDPSRTLRPRDGMPVRLTAR